jgi:catechol 2,3-dioxygenase-like lactoylglutathione lyase family enzyme
MKSLFPVICSKHLTESRDFYVNLLDFTVAFDSDFYVLLQSPATPSLQLAFVEHAHDSVPSEFQVAPQGVLVTIEVDAVDPIHERAQGLGLRIAQELRDEVFGQRHFMTVDPNGLLVDVVQPIPFDPEFAQRYGIDVS